MVKLGYKQTEIGVIPEDWEISKLGNIGQFKNGINKDKDKFGYGVPIIGLMDVFGKNHINSTSNSGLVDASPYEQEDYSLKEGDVLFVRSSVKPAGVGLTAVVEQTLQNAVFSGFLLRYRTEKMTVGFKRYVFYASYFRENLIAASTVSANTNINQDSLKQLVLAYPTNEAEQNKIAQTISSIDALLLSLEKQISKKKAIKQGAMQELLTGKKRLPGFTGTWKEVKLADISLKITDGSHESPPESDVGYYMPSVKDMTDIGFDYSGCKKISFSDFKKLERNGCRPNVGDVLIAKDGSILKYAFVQEKTEDIVILSSIAIVKPHPSYVDSYFLAQYFRQNQFVDKVITNYKSGTGVPRIVLKGFKQITLCIPDSVAEQAEIAEILVGMDKEIYELEQKLEKYRQIKQGMMQKLLTGKIRLV